MRRLHPSFLPLLAVVLAATACGREARPRGAPSLLLVTLDTTRADRIGAYGGPAGSTPHLDALAARGLRFERAFTTVPMTLPAHATLLTGRLPTATGMRSNGTGRLPEDVPTLAERFAAAGYATGAFVSAAVLDHAFGLARGFARYDDEVGRNGGVFRSERSGHETVARALAWLAERPADRPVFLWVHLFEPHDPYVPPAPYAERFAADPYQGEIAAADAALGELLAAPRWAPGARAVVAVIGDHGESLGEHGEATHGLLVHDAVLHVPFVLAAPETPPGVIGAEVGAADLAPTLLALAGLPPIAVTDGNDLAGLWRRPATEPRPETLYAESLYGQQVYGWAPLTAARRAGWKLVVGARRELFDTRSDPGELRDLTASSPPQAAALERYLNERQASARATTPAAVDEALRGQLQGLGYLTGGGTAPVDASAAGDPRDRVAVHERLRTADSRLRAGDVEGAERALGEALAADPKNRLALNAATDALGGAIGRAEGASDPDLVLRLRLVRAQILAGAGDRDGARRELVAMADAPIAGAAGIRARAFARLQVGRALEARRDWEELARRAPEDASVRLNLASLALAESRFQDAARWGREAVALAPGSPGAHNSLGIALEELGDARGALAEYRAALGAEPRFWQAELNLGLLEAKRGEREEARRHLAAFLTLAPDNPRAAEARSLLSQLGGGAP